MGWLPNADVPCNGCTECCRGPDRRLFMDPVIDNVRLYRTERWRGITILANKPNGDCIYLGDQGCTIYEQRPNACRIFSCVDKIRSGLPIRIRLKGQEKKEEMHGVQAAHRDDGGR